MWIDLMVERVRQQRNHDSVYAVRQASALFKKVKRDESTILGICQRYLDSPPDELLNALHVPKETAALTLLDNLEYAKSERVNPLEVVEAIFNASPSEVPSGRAYYDEESEVPRKVRRKGY